MFVSLSAWLASLFGVSNDFVTKLLASIAVFVVYVVVRRLVLQVVGRRFEDSSTRYRFNKGSQILFLTIAAIVLFRVWFHDASGIGTWLGLVSAGIAVALQDPLENLAGWLYFVTRRPFRVGDRIQVGSHAGDVVDVHLFSFSLLEIGNWVDADQSTGRLIHIPNGWLFKHSIAGYDQGFPYIWNEIVVTVTCESDWRKAKAELEKILATHAEKVEEANESEVKVFGTLPRPLSTGAAASRTTAKGGFEAILGQWPGDESDEKLVAQLRELS